MTLTGTYGVLSGAVLSGQTYSEQFDLHGYYTDIGLRIPTITSSAITFEVSPTSGLLSGNTLRNLSGAYSIAAETGGFSFTDESLKQALAPWRYARIIVETQTDGRHFQFIVRA